MMKNLQESKSPSFISKINTVEFQAFKEKVFQNRKGFLNDLRQGNVFIVKNVLSKSIINDLKKKIFDYGNTTKTTWHDPFRGAPNFHQIDNRSEYFKLKKCAHVFHFFSWNKDKFKIFKYLSEVLYLFNFINGNNDKINKSLINRLQVHHYPKGAGFMDYHTDPDILVKTIATLYMSEPGKEYNSGGLVLMDSNSKKISIDKKVRKGDMVFAYPTLKHGCDPVDINNANSEVNWNDPSGRWLFLFNTLKIKQVSKVSKI